MSGIVKFVDSHRMVTIHKDGRREIGTKEESLLWIKNHVKTAIHCEAIIAGIATKMTDDSEVFFEEKTT